MGIRSFGGNSSSVANKITNKSHSDFSAVTDISATGSAFAAIRSDGSVITWGNTQDGGDSSGVASSLNEVLILQMLYKFMPHCQHLPHFKKMVLLLPGVM